MKMHLWYLRCCFFITAAVRVYLSKGFPVYMSGVCDIRRLIYVCFFFLPSPGFGFVISLFINLKDEIQGYLHVIPPSRFKATTANRSFRASPEDGTKQSFIFNDYVKNET